jgi:hypothetical protein
MPNNDARPERRNQLLREIERLARVAVFGTLSQTYRECGTTGCRCHGPGPKHGPYLTVSYREAGKTRGYSVPKDAEQGIREGIEAWRQMLECLRELAEINKQRVLEHAQLERSK